MTKLIAEIGLGRVNKVKYNTFVVYLRILFSKILEATPATRYLATAGLRKDPRKFYTDLLIRTHALEKGMSIGKARFGFGKPKAISLLKDLQHYLNIDHINRIKREMNIPDNEQPVLLIGYGSYKNKWKSAKSKRKRWGEYTYWNE